MLTVKQEKYVQNLVNGMSQREAYKNSYNAVKMKDTTVDNKASKLFKKDEIRARYKELIKQLEDDCIMSAKDRMIWLTDIINGNISESILTTSDIKDGKSEFINYPTKIDTKLKALDILNKMDGRYVTKINGDLDLTIEVGIIED